MVPIGTELENAMLNQQNRLLARLTLSALMGVAACLPTLTHAEALNFEEAAHRLQANSDRLAMTRFSVESAQLKEQATRHLGGPVVTAGAAAFRFQGAVQGIDLTPLTHTIGSSIAALPAPLATGLAHLPPLPNSLDLSTQRSGNTSSVSAILPIYTGGATTAIKQALQAKTEEARADGRQVQQEVFNEFVQRYFGAQLAERVAGLREVAYRTVSEHDAATQRMLEAGLVAQVERLQARAAMEDAKRNALKARDDAELASTALARTLRNAERIQPMSPLFVISSPIEPLGYFTDAALERHPGLAKVAAKKREAEQIHALEESQKKPAVFAFGQRQLRSSDQANWVVGVGVSWRLWGGVDRSLMSEASHRLIEMADSQDKQARNDIALLVEKRWMAVDQTRRQFLALTPSLELANAVLQLKTKGQKAGTNSTLELIDAEVNLTKAKTEQAQAAYDYVKALADLLEVSGLSDQFGSYMARADLKVQ